MNKEVEKFLKDLDGYDTTLPSIVKCLKEHLAEYLDVYGSDREDRKKFLVDKEVDYIIRLYRVNRFEELLLDLAIEKDLENKKETEDNERIR